MQMIYTFLEKVLPFSYMNYEFMKNAFLAIMKIGYVSTIQTNPPASPRFGTLRCIGCEPNRMS